MTEKQIKLEQFEGPLGLLLELIEQEQLDITDLSLAKVTDQYIAILEAQTELHPEEIADFLLVAAKLLYLKSKIFSPDYFTTVPETEETDLARQLRLYQTYLQVAKQLQKRWRSDSYFYSRLKPWRWPQKKFIAPIGLQAADLVVLMQDVLAQLAPIARIKIKKIKNVISIKEKIEQIKNFIFSRQSFAWNELVGKTVTKTERIVSFLAILELVKQREVAVYQETIFANFTISKNNKD